MKKIFIIIFAFVFICCAPSLDIQVTDGGDNTLKINTGAVIAYPNKQQVWVHAQGNNVRVSWGNNTSKDFIMYDYTAYTNPSGASAIIVAQKISVLINN